MAITDDAIDAIKQMIVDGTLRPGDRLPREADLAERLGLSRSSLREAVRALSAMNVLTVRQGDGTYVTGLEPDLLLESMAFLVDLHRDTSVVHLLQIRRLLEPAAAAIAATAMSEEEVARLQSLLDSLPEQPDLDQLVEADVAFHGAIAASTGNPILCSLLDTISTRSQRARHWRGLTEAGAIGRTVTEHRRILAAIAARDADAARAWATVHIEGVESWVRASMGE